MQVTDVRAQKMTQRVNVVELVPSAPPSGEAEKIPRFVPAVQRGDGGRMAKLAAGGSQINQCEVLVPCPTPTGPQKIPVEINLPGAALRGATLSRELKPAIERIAPATVFVRAYTGTDMQGWSGSGVIMTPDQLLPELRTTLPPDTYLILTNHHVASGAKALTVTLADGTELAATPLKSRQGNQLVMDEITDCAVLVVHSPVPLATAIFGDPRTLQPGDTVITAGHPKGLPRLSVTTGIVSQPRQATGFKPFPVIQFDAAINGGNSGGPLVNIDGQVLGLNTFTFRESDDMSFAIPWPEQFTVLQRLYETGVFHRSQLDLTLAPFPLHLRALAGFPLDHGARVGRIGAGVDLASGITAGDVITNLRGSTGDALPVRMNSPYDQSVIDGWIQRQPPYLPIMVEYYREVDERGKKSWRRFETVVVPALLTPTANPGANAPVAHAGSWSRSSAVYRTAA